MSHTQTDQGVDAAGVPRRRIGLRLRPDTDQAAPRQVELAFHPSADLHGLDRDILFGYQIFLGRDPENSFVIAEAKATPLSGFLRGLLGSGEFQTSVGQPLLRGAVMPHERSAGGPSAAQVDWLMERLVLPRELAAGLRAARDWRSFWTLLAETGMFALAAKPRPAPEGGIVAATPEGGFVLITIDQPQPGVKIHPGSAVSGSGWVIAPSDVTEVSLYLDDTLLTHARYGLPRPDVARNFPHYRHVDHCGFAFSARVPDNAVIARGSELVISIRTADGLTGRRGLRVEPPASAPAAVETWPLRLFVEDVRVDAEGELRLRGWAVSRARLAGITIFLGDARLGTASHGLSRPDIAASHADYPNAADSGFVFAASLRGRHSTAPGGQAAIRIEAADAEGRTRQAIVPVTLPAAAPDSAARRMEAAIAGNTRLVCDVARLSPQGRLALTGWALADLPVRRLGLAADGEALGEATLGLKRPDVAKRHPAHPGAPIAGFRFAGDVPPGRLKPGGMVTLLLELADGTTHSLNVKTELADATTPLPAAASPVRLELDRPVIKSGHATAPVRGALTISGWTTAPDGIDRVSVECDGAALGDAYLGMRREDIARAFPDHEGALRAGFALVLPPGAVAEGQRAFTLTAHARGGAVAVLRFEVAIEAPEAELPGSHPRRAVPRAEAAFTRAILAAQGGAPRFRICVRAAGASAVSLRDTLRSLAAQLALTEPPGDVGAADSGAADSGAADSGAADSGADNVRAADFDVLVSVRGADAVPKVAALAAQAGLAGRVLACPPGQALPASPAGAWRLALQAGDTLGADALLEFAACQVMHPKAGLIYADDRRQDLAQGRMAPCHKPDFSPEFLLATNYIGRAWAAGPATLAGAGLTDADLLESGAYDLALRLTEAAGQVARLPRLLAETPSPESAEAEAAALQAAALRRGLAAQAEAQTTPGIWRLRRATPADGLVSVIIPTAGRGGLIRQAIETLRQTAGRPIEIVALDNIPASNKAMRTWLRRHADRVVEMRGAFNWSRFNNEGAAAASGDYLLFLNDDIEARSPGWLDAMLEYAQLPEVAVVGARLLYPDGKVQHNGQYLADGHARHAFRFADRAEPGPFGLACAAREMSSVTGACQLIRRAVFDRLGRFDEAHDVINNDLDFCLRAQAAGMKVIFTPHAELMHHELASRAALEDSYDEARFSSAWRLAMLRGDPYRGAGLLADSDQSAPEPEPVVAVHAGPRGPDAASLRRILAVKLDHIGDFLTARPALAALRSRFPQARITLLAPPATASLATASLATASLAPASLATANLATAELATGQDIVDEVIEFSFFHARSGDGRVGLDDAAFQALAAQLAPHRFDLALDLRLQPETREVLRHTGAKMLAGYDHDGRFPFLDVALEWEGDARLLAKHAHVSERLLQLVEACALACRPVAPARAAPMRPAAGVPALAALGADFLARTLICVHPGVGNPVRQWPAGHFAGLIDLLVAEYDVNAVLVGGPEEQEVAREVMALVAAPDRVASLAGAVSLAGLGEVMAACALFVGNNSGPKHLAASLGVPTVGVHSAVVDAGEWAPVGGTAMALQRRVLCGPCYLEFAQDCPRALACLTGLRPREVLAACRRAMALRPPPRVEQKPRISRGRPGKSSNKPESN